MGMSIEQRKQHIVDLMLGFEESDVQDLVTMYNERKNLKVYIPKYEVGEAVMVKSGLDHYEDVITDIRDGKYWFGDCHLSIDRQDYQLSKKD